MRSWRGAQKNRCVVPEGKEQSSPTYLFILSQPQVLPSQHTVSVNRDGASFMTLQGVPTLPLKKKINLNITVSLSGFIFQRLQYN